MYFMIFVECFFFFNDTATTEIYTLSLHDALPISGAAGANRVVRLPDAGDRLTWRTLQRKLWHERPDGWEPPRLFDGDAVDRKSTRLNSSHANISYAVFCLKKKKNTVTEPYNLLY